MSRRRLVLVALGAGLLLVLLRTFTALPFTLTFTVKVVGLGLKLSFLFTGMLGWGLTVARPLPFSKPLDAVTGFALGSVLTATVLGTLVNVRFPTDLEMVAWLVAGCALLVTQRRDLHWPSKPAITPAPDPTGAPSGRFVTLWIAAFLVVPLLLALAPAISLDSLVYHLAIPAQYRMAGHAFAMPWNIHSYFPQHAETLYGLALALGGDVLAQLWHLLAAVLTLIVLHRLGDRRVGMSAGIWTALLLISLPALTVIAGWAWNDWFVLFFLALALEAVQDRLEDPADGSAYLRTALFLGAALSVKHSALPMLVLLAVPWPRLPIRTLSAAAVAVLIPASPWYLRNLWLEGNPLYPLFSGEAIAGHLGRYRGDASGLDRVLGYLARPDLVDESPGLLLPALLPLLFLSTSARGPRSRPLWWIVALYLVAALVYHPTIRSFAPMFLALALLTGGAVAELTAADRTKPGTAPGRWLLLRSLALITSLVLSLNLVQVVWVYRQYQPTAAALGFEPAASYLQDSQRYYRMFGAIDANAGAEDRVLVLGESRILYLERPAIAASYLDPNPLEPFLAGDCPVDCLARRLWQAGVRVVYVDRRQLRLETSPRPSLTDELQFPVSPSQNAALEAFLAESGDLVAQDGEIQVFTIRAPASGP